MHPLIAAQLAKPKTHKVVTTYAAGNVHIHETASESQAENFAIGQRRKIGRNLINMVSRQPSRVVSVEVKAI